MKAKDLIKILESNPEAEVVMRSDNFELQGAIVPVRTVMEQTAVLEKKTFTDAFDYTQYDIEVYSLKSGGTEKILYLI